MSTQRKSAGKKAKKQGHKYERSYTKAKSGAIWEDVNPKRKSVNSIFGGKTTPKTDGFENIDTLNEAVSIKNSTQSTQIQVCSLDRFAKKFDLPQSVYEKLQMFLGAWPEVTKAPRTTSEPFLKKCTELGINISTLDKDTEIRRSRIKAKNIPNFQEVLDWFDDNKEGVTRFIFQESFIHPSEKDAMPTKVVYALKKNDPNKTKSFTIDSLVSRTGTLSEVKINSHHSTVIRIGAYTLQMKGSQKEEDKTSSAYHNMQFNCARSDIEKHLKL